MCRVVGSYDGLDCDQGNFGISHLVDSDERFLAAVSQDGTTHLWSLFSAQRLYQLPSPRPITRRSDLPRITFSDSWGGCTGNSAIILASGCELRVYCV